MANLNWQRFIICPIIWKIPTEYFEQIQSPNLRWSFTINHAHFDPIGIKGFVEGMDMSLCEEVRVADNNGKYEIHMKPGTGNVDFGEMFRLI